MTTEIQKKANRSFKPLLPILIGFIAFALFNIVATVGITFSKFNESFNFKYGNFLPTKFKLLDHNIQASHQKPDILFFGTSQTNHGFIPSVFKSNLTNQNHTIFNFGLPNNRYDIMQGVLEYQIQRGEKPKLVLLEVGPSLQERNSPYFYLPALYYRTLIENSPSLAWHWLSNPLLDQDVRKELLTSAFSVLRQYRYTFSPINILDKVSNKASSVAQSKLQPLTGKFANFTDPNVEATAPPTLDPSPAERGGEIKISKNEKQLGISPRISSSSPLSKNVLSPPLSAGEGSRVGVKPFDPKVLEQWQQDGWYLKETSPHMGTPEGVTESVEEARQYFILSQKSVHFDKLRAFLKYCQKQNIPVVLVSWPNHPGMNQAFSKASISPDYFRGLQELRNDFPRTPYINMNSQNSIEGLNPEIASKQGLFADPRHLTAIGAKLYTEKLARKIENENLLH